jgi:hypothetical protein
VECARDVHSASMSKLLSQVVDTNKEGFFI